MKYFKYLPFYIILLIVLFAYTAYAQTNVINGRVVDEATGEGLEGATIVALGTEYGTNAGVDGNFSLSISDIDSLQVSFVGYETQVVSVRGKDFVNILLNSRTVLNQQLVVMGYRTTSSESLTGSVTQLSGSDLVNESVTSSNPVELLQGKASGVFISNTSGQPGASPEIRIRGTGSISASVDPLYVIDGVIAGDGSSRALDAISPGDIESISILKDASATALYGSRAANGVVVINTKGGRSGEMRVNIRASGGTTEALRGRLEMMNSQELYDFHKLMGDPNLNESVLNHDVNWRDLMFSGGSVQNYEASVSGGNEKTRFYTSLSYYNEDGTLPRTDFDKVNARLNVTSDVTERFQISAHVSANFNKSQDIAAGANYDALVFAYRTMPWDYPRNEDGSLRTGLEQDWYTRDHENPLFPMQWNYNKSKSNFLLGNLKLKYQFTDWLYFTTTNQFTNNVMEDEIYFDSRTQKGGSNNGELHESSTTDYNILTSNIMHFNKTYGSHTITALLGYEYQTNHLRGINVTGVGIPTDLVVLDAAASVLNTSGAKEQYMYASGFGDVNYTYKNRYSIEASLRRDGSSRFGKDKRYGIFYSGGLSWNINNEDFMSDMEAVNQLKLRLSYGTVGNADIGNYESLGLYSFKGQYNGGSASYPFQPANSNLTWEVAHNWDIGLDFGLWNRINLILDVYRIENKDLLQQVQLPGTDGYDSHTLNVGDVRNTGLELTLSTINLNGKFKWSTDLNMGFNKNRVISLFNHQPIILNADQQGNDVSHQRIAEGYSINEFYLRRWLGVNPENGDPQYEKLLYDDNGKMLGKEPTNNYNDAQLQMVGNGDPKFVGGINNTFEYNHFSLNVFFNFVYGNKLFNGILENFASDGAYPNMNNLKMIHGRVRWEKPGDEATEPKAVFGGNNNSQKPTTRHLEDGSFLRLKNVRLSYSFPTSIIEPIGMRSLALFFSGDNLLTIFNGFTGMDPEGPIGSGSIENKYPISRKITFGINIGL